MSAIAHSRERTRRLALSGRLETISDVDLIGQPDEIELYEERGNKANASAAPEGFDKCIAPGSVLVQHDFSVKSEPLQR